MTELQTILDRREAVIKILERDAQDAHDKLANAAAELRRLHAENATLQQGYDAARLEIDSLQARVQELGAMLRENRSKRIVELEAQLEAIGAGGVEPLRSRTSGSCAPAAPQVEEDAASQVEHLDVENHRLRRAMQKIMARLADLLDEDQFGNIESIVTEAGVEPPEPAAQAAPAVPQDTPEAIDGTIQVLKECGGFTEQAPVIRQLRRYATLLAALTTQGASRG